LMAFTLLAAPGCRKSLEVSRCIQAKINEVATNPASIIVRVDEYVFKGQTVYLFADSPEIADCGATVYDRDCNQLCFLGGIAGLVDCQGLRFGDHAVFKRTLWSR
ncbi:MAG TPA: hypothetical protein VF145_04270, partial [Chitinophagaceae bacterium]